MKRGDPLEDAERIALIAALKAARTRGGGIDLNQFLPPRGHPLYLPLRRELVRADLEYAWQHGERRLLLDYVAVFPDLLDDRATIEAVAFAEFRLRLLAGEDPAPTEYAWQFGLTTSAWAGRVLETSTPPVAALSDGESTTEIVMAPEEVLTRVVAPTPDFLTEGAEAEPEVEAAHWLHQAMNALPAVGTQFLSFELIAELGRGGFGRVYLARQGDLAHRLVALKITVDLFGEEQKLAQLQHTNVVPVYSFHQAGGLHAVCMPYFGATTLADIVRGLRIQAKLPESGTSLVNAVRTRRQAFHQAAAPAQPERNGPPQPAPQRHGLARFTDEEDVPVTLAMLEETSYVDAVLWLAERLTEGLSHAHERGILHRDLKPANILLTDDGQPMLLDFNLSADTKLDGGLQERRVGGTLPYMAPEHLASLQGGTSAVDERSDVYALGVIIYELLTGRLPCAAPLQPAAAAIPAMIAARMKPPPFLRPWNPAVSFGVESLVRHCLAGEPGRRYQSARQLREDLKRQRQHRPLRHASEPSLRERLQKWMRRHPRAVSPATLGMVTALVLALALAPVSWQTWQDWETRNAERDAALLQAKADAEAVRTGARQRSDALNHYHQFHDSLGSARALMESVNAVQVLPRFMKAWTCEETRLRDSAAKCRISLEHYAVLQNADWQDQPLARHLPAPEGEQLRREVTEFLFALAQAEQVRGTHLREEARRYDPVHGALAMLGGGLDVWGAWQTAAQVPWHTAFDLNERARRSCAADAIPRALLIQQAELLQRLGRDAEAKPWSAQAERAPIRPNTEDAYWTASALATRGDYRSALPLLGQTVRATPDHYGAWLLRGLCLTEKFSVASLQRDPNDRQKALECFTTCIVLRPSGLWAYYNRGLVSYHLNLYPNAVADFNRLLEKEILDQQPAFATAYVPRATALFALEEYAEAERDLSKAIALEPNVTDYYYLRARVRRKLKKTADAERDEQQILASTPATAEGWIYRGKACFAHDPRAALAAFDEALALEPEDPATLFAKGCLLALVLQRHPEAVRVLDKSLALKPDYAEARIMRGLAYAALGERASALKDADAVLESAPTPQMYYQAARIYAQTSRRHPTDAPHAISLLKFALRHGYGVQAYRQEPDLAPLRKMPEFEQLGVGLKYLGVPP